MHNAGFEAFAVGGCIRDIYMGKNPHDFDVTTNALPEQIKHVFSDYKTYDTGIKHGTLSIMFEGIMVEITTYRTESGYSDMRHPNSVKFVKSIEEDLKRRDFTINALAFDNKNLIDLFGGSDDIDNKIIRCIGNPNDRFKEDGLRILRALRFSATLGFKINSETGEAINKDISILSHIAKERINVELFKMFESKYCFEVLKEYRDVIEYITCPISDLQIDLISNTVDDFYIRFALIYDEKSYEILKKLKFDRNTIKTVCSLVENKNLKCDINSVAIAINNLGEDGFVLLCNYLDCLNNSGKKIINIMNNLPIKSISQLDFNGSDIIKNTNLKGKEIGECLIKLFLAVVNGKCNNFRDELTDYLKHII